jgi:hypothetical protein
VSQEHHSPAWTWMQIVLRQDYGIIRHVVLQIFQDAQRHMHTTRNNSSRDATPRRNCFGYIISFFQSAPECKLHGSGQGSSSSPPLLMTISIILFCTLKAQVGTGATYTCPRHHLTTNHTTEAFINNSTNFINSPNHNEPTKH